MSQSLLYLDDELTTQSGFKSAHNNNLVESLTYILGLCFPMRTRMNVAIEWNARLIL